MKRLASPPLLYFGRRRGQEQTSPKTTSPGAALPPRPSSFRRPDSSETTANGRLGSCSAVCRSFHI